MWLENGTVNMLQIFQFEIENTASITSLVYLDLYAEIASFAKQTPWLKWYSDKNHI